MTLKTRHICRTQKNYSVLKTSCQEEFLSPEELLGRLSLSSRNFLSRTVKTFSVLKTLFVQKSFLSRGLSLCGRLSLSSRHFLSGRIPLSRRLPLCTRHLLSGRKNFFIHGDFLCPQNIFSLEEFRHPEYFHCPQDIFSPEKFLFQRRFSMSSRHFQTVHVPLSKKTFSVFKIFSDWTCSSLQEEFLCLQDNFSPEKFLCPERISLSPRHFLSGRIHLFRRSSLSGSLFLGGPAPLTKKTFSVFKTFSVRKSSAV